VGRHRGRLRGDGGVTRRRHRLGGGTPSPEERHDELLRRYLQELAATPLLGADEELDLARSARGGDASAGEHLVKGNRRLVAALAKRYAATGVPMLDLIQEGNLGLLHAVESFDPDKGFSFRTYATWWIRQAIAKAASTPGPTFEGRVQAAWDRLVEANGRQPTVDELATAVGVDREQIQDLLAPPPDLDDLP
jgi:DNA-directed RNA polymerase sigma subunit (sigma70/sigma32)